MRQEHPVFDRAIDPDAPVWRYFDLAKFTAFLQQRALFFARADLLGDPLEGSFTQAYAAQREALIGNPPEGRTSQIQEEIFRHNERIFATDPKTIFVSCWHLGDHESMAMWRGYGGGPYGVAIRSTFDRLDRSIPDMVENPYRSEPVFVGRVRYIDYTSLADHLPHEFNVYGRFMCKSVAYRDEREVRAVFTDFSTHMNAVPPPGYAVPVELTILSPTVVVSPLAPSWFRETVERLCVASGLEWQVASSIAATKPVF
jgi:hypothetical protein